MCVSINAAHFINTAPWEEKRSVQEALELCATAGFRTFDLITGDLEEASNLAEFLANRGLSVGQSHIPYNRYKRADYDEFSDRMLCHAEGAHILGSPILVVHGDEFDYSAAPFTKEAALEFNVRLFTPLVDYAASHGMRVAFENLFCEHNKQDMYRFCSRTEELLLLVDSFPKELVGICWDSGHGKVSYGQAHIEALAQVADRVIATHIHDNYYDRDLHLPPFMGNCDWAAFMKTLRRGGYGGTISLELVYDRLPQAVLPEWLTGVYHAAVHLSQL